MITLKRQECVESKMGREHDGGWNWTSDVHFRMGFVEHAYNQREGFNVEGERAWGKLMTAAQVWIPGPMQGEKEEQ